MSQANPTDIEADLYANNFIKFGDKTKALKSAFPNSTANQNTSNKQASLFHNLPKIPPRIKVLQEQAEEIAKKEYKWSVTQRLDDLMEIKERGMELDMGAPGLSVAVKAVNEANKMLGGHDPEKKDITSGGDKINNWIIQPVEKV